jgi:hypothetical protein
MNVIIGDKKFQLVDCISFFSRFKGLMFTRNIDHCMRFSRCNSIHTFFMFECIDVVMTDKDNNVLYIFKNVKPFRVILPRRGVYNVYELPCNSINEKILKVGVIV